MSAALINRSPDLKRLCDEGYEVEVRSGFLLVHSVPYVTAHREIAKGTLVSELTLAGDVTARPGNHMAYFVGGHPCTVDGVEISSIKNGSGPKDLGGGLVASYTFSNKPSAGYADHYEKMTRYIKIIEAEAQALDSLATACTFQPMPVSPEESVFAYRDTASSRAGTTTLSERLASQRVAIVGLGGTGSYVLDLVAKTPVREIHLFDDDAFLSHNAFRAPGAASIEDLREKRSKVDYLHGIYSRIRSGIFPHPWRVTTSSDLADFDFVFVCVDNGEARKIVADALLAVRVPFIDTGMGIQWAGEGEGLCGICRVTTVTPEKNAHLSLIPMGGGEQDNAYSLNIQIAELNSLSAALAVIRWKKLSGFYQDLEKEHNLLYALNVCQLTAEEGLL